MIGNFRCLQDIQGVDMAYMKSNLCNLFNSDLRCASLRGVEFVFKKERREKEGAVEVMFERVN